MSALVVSQFISAEARTQLADTALDYLAWGVLESNQAGPNRFRKKIFNTQYCNPLMSELGKRIADHLNICECPVDPYLGWIISLIQPGGFIQPHRDAHPHYQQTGDKHLRCNILVQGDDESVRPRIGNMQLELEEGDLWAFFASDYVHGTNVIKGDKARIVYQFGFVVPADYPLATANGVWQSSIDTQD